MALGSLRLGASHSPHLMARPAISPRAAQLVAPRHDPPSVERRVFRLRIERGKCVVFKLASVPVHFEGFSGSPDPDAGNGISRGRFRLLDRARVAVGRPLLSPLSGTLPGSAQGRAARARIAVAARERSTERSQDATPAPFPLQYAECHHG